MAGTGTSTRGTDDRGTSRRGLSSRSDQPRDQESVDGAAEELTVNLSAPPTDPGFDVKVAAARVAFSLPDESAVVLGGTGLTEGPLFAYEYLPGIPARPYPILRLVAAPGVAIRSEGPSTQALAKRVRREGARGLLTARLEIFRVQEVSDIPSRGDPIRPIDYLGVPVDVLRRGPAAYQTVLPYRRLEGVDLMHSSGDTLRITIPIESATARFAYEILPPEADRSWSIVRVVKTPAVAVTLFSRAVNVNPLSRVTTPLDPQILVYEVPRVSDVPDVGKPWKNLGKALDKIPFVKYHLPQTAEEVIAFAVADLLISLVPVVGSLVAIAELAYGIVTGENKWGRPLTNLDLFILGVGAVLPFAAEGRAALGLSRAVGRPAQECATVLAGIRQLEEQNLERLVELTRTVQAGKSLPLEDAGELTKMVQSVAKAAPEEVAAGIATEKIAPAAKEGTAAEKVGEKAVAAEKTAPAAAHAVEAVQEAAKTGVAASKKTLLTIDDIITKDGKGIVEANEDLKQIAAKYRDYVSRNPEAHLPPDEWISHVTTPGPLRSALEKVLGPDYAKGIRSAQDRFVRLSAYPRPEGYDPAQDLRRLFASTSNRELLFDRLKDLVAELRELLPGFMNRGRLRILKGNIGEVLSKEAQQQALAEVRQVDKDAQLFSGITAQRVVDEVQGKLVLGDPVLFSDNIIASVRGGNLQIHIIFEVKSGFIGGQEATSQIFKWIERFANEGLRLNIPGAGSFVYAPGSQDLGRLVGFARAERVIIAARGTERLGLRSAEQVAASVRRISLERSSTELDYLARRVIESITPRPK
jgi:hypothetical protein